MEFGTIAIEVAKKIGEVVKKVEDVQQKIDNVTKPVEMTKKITDEKTGNYAGDIIGNKAINKVKVSLSDSLNKYFEGKEVIPNSDTKDTVGQPLDNNHKEVDYIKIDEKLKLENCLDNFLNSKESIDESAKNSYEENIDNMKQDEVQGDSTIEENGSKDMDVDENTEKKGGRFGDVFKSGEGEKYEVHHMPANSSTELDRNDGPAIKMDKEDHRETASCGNSKDAREYQARQRELIENGKFREALQMDIDDIREKFGDKYDEAIAEMLEYVSKLEEEGKI